MPSSCVGASQSLQKNGDFVCLTSDSYQNIAIIIGEGFKLEAYDEVGNLKESADNGYASTYATTRIIATKDNPQLVIYRDFCTYAYEQPIKQNHIYILKHEWQQKYNVQYDVTNKYMGGTRDFVTVIDPSAAKVTIKPNPHAAALIDQSQNYISSEKTYTTTNIQTYPIPNVDITNSLGDLANGTYKSMIDLSVKSTNENQYLPDKVFLAEQNRVYRLTDEDYGEYESGLSAGAIAGIVVACVVVVAVIIFLIVWFCVLKKGCGKKKTAEPATNN